jgi:hypothetical protein
MKTAFSIFQTMTISPFQNLILNALDFALTEGGFDDMELYFEQLTPLVILSQTAEETGKTVAQVEDETNDAMENPATQDNPGDQTIEEPLPTNMSSAHFAKEYEIYKK